MLSRKEIVYLKESAEIIYTTGVCIQGSTLHPPSSILAALALALSPRVLQ
jgi:hypothetical protein